MFPIGEASFLAKKKQVFSNSSHKTAEAIVLDLGRGGFGCGGRDASTELRC